MGTHVASQCVALGQQRIYSLGARFLRDTQSNQAGGGRLRLHWYSQEDCQGSSSPTWKNADPEDKSGWQALTIEKLIAPKEARSARIEIIQSVKGPGRFVAFWDDIVFMPIE